MTNKDRLFLLDAMALAYRAYFAFIRNPLKNSKGENTSAVYGFLTFLNRILTQENPNKLAVVFDAGKPTFRHEIYKEYKATRQKMPEDMITQIELIKEIVQAYNIPLIEMEGYEADDIIGTLAKQAEANNIETLLVTPDKDFMQLVSEKTKIFKPGKQGTEVEIIDIDGVKKRFGVPPENVIDVLAIIGDASDNIPGVPGIGEKTAIPLIQKYGTLENLYKHIDEIQQKGVREKLIANKESAFLSKKLLTINTSIELPFNYNYLIAKEPDHRKLIEIFERLEFRSFVSKLRQKKESAPITEQDNSNITKATNDITTDDHAYSLITNKEDFLTLCKKLRESEEFVFDTETSSIDALNAELTGISFSLKPREAFFVPVTSSDKISSANDLFAQNQLNSESKALPVEFVCKELKPVFESANIKKIGHNIKYDMLVLSKYGIELSGDIFDTMVAHYILKPDGQHGLDSVASEYLDYKTISYAELTGKGKEQKELKDIPVEQISNYSCEDSDITFRLYEIFFKKLNEDGLVKLCQEVEFPLIYVLYRMEKKGVAIDTSYLKDMAKDLDRQLENLRNDIYRLAGTQFNINSTQQLGEILFNRLKLRTVRKTKTGYSTDISVLETLKGEHPIIDLLLDYRQLSKLKSTYVDTLPDLVNPRTKRVHTSFNQTITATGRLSSSDPNLQNIPIRTEVGRLIRRAFVPGDSESVILSADYSQIELRVMAHMSKDEGLIEAFKNGEDIHTTTAVKIFGVKPEEVNREMRRKAKEVNFGIMYGIGPYGLASRLEISQTEARKIIERYFSRFPRVQEYINYTISKARQNGYVTTLLGRRRYLPDINSKNQTVRQNAERQAINMPIQGTAADMIKLAMVRIDSAFLKGNLRSSMILQVHDELVFEVKKKELENVRSIVEQEMRNALSLCVPIEVEIGVGKNWLEAH